MKKPPSGGFFIELSPRPGRVITDSSPITRMISCAHLLSTLPGRRPGFCRGLVITPRQHAHLLPLPDLDDLVVVPLGRRRSLPSELEL